MKTQADKLLSVVLPAYNEAAGIQAAIETLARVCGSLPYAFELIVVDDGSRDHTFDQASAMADAGFPVRAIRLSRNFGKEAALLAGLRNARGDAVITIDADLQHPPSLIPRMVAAWERGAKIVNGVKRDRGDLHWWGAARAYIVNSMISALGGLDVQNSSDFKLLDRAAVDVLTRHLGERRRFYRGLTGWIGFSQTTLEFDVAPRTQGKSGFSLRSLIALSLTATISFTSAPLRIVSVLGLLTFVLGLGVGTDALYSWFEGVSVSGYMTLIATLLLLGSFIMISLGVIGEYIAKIYDESKQRPAFVIDSMHESEQLTLAGHRRERADERSRNQLAARELDVARALNAVHTAPDQHSWPTQFLEFTHDAIIIWEMGGRGILYWNRAAEQLYGYNRSEAYGKTTHTLLNTQLSGGVTQLERNLARFGVWVGELRHTTRDGRELYVEGNLALLSQHNGQWLVLEVNRNITDQRTAEDAHEAMERQLVTLHLLHRSLK